MAARSRLSRDLPTGRACQPPCECQAEAGTRTSTRMLTDHARFEDRRALRLGYAFAVVGYGDCDGGAVAGDFDRRPGASVAASVLDQRVQDPFGQITVDRDPAGGAGHLQFDLSLGRDLLAVLGDATGDCKCIGAAVVLTG